MGLASFNRVRRKRAARLKYEEEQRRIESEKTNAERKLAEAEIEAQRNKIAYEKETEHKRAELEAELEESDKRAEKEGVDPALFRLTKKQLGTYAEQHFDVDLDLRQSKLDLVRGIMELQQESDSNKE